MHTREEDTDRQLKVPPREMFRDCQLNLLQDRIESNEVKPQREPRKRSILGHPLELLAGLDHLIQLHGTLVGQDFHRS